MVLLLLLVLLKTLVAKRQYNPSLCIGNFEENMDLSHIYLAVRDMVVESCNRRFGRETIHPTKKFASMNLLQMSCVIT